MTTGDTAENSMFGMLAVVLGFLAFAAVVGHFFVGPVEPPPPVEVSIAEKAASIRDATVAALKGEQYEAERKIQPRTLDDYLTYSFIALAVVAILLSVIGFVKHERPRPSIAGAALGGLAITFQFATMVFFALLCAIVLAAVIDKLDFDF
jgi:small-conductance mechanosensitive channel